LENQLRKRAEAIREQNPVSSILARFTLSTDNTQLPPAVWDEWLPEITAQLRRDFSGGSHPLWTTEVAVLPQTLPIDLVNQKSLLGDYLRALEEQVGTNDKRFATETFGVASAVVSQVSEYMNWNDPEIRKQTLQEAAWLGIRLLNTDHLNEEVV
jgi:hypothetical protein